ncbi:MAG: phosphatase family protein [Ferruginibacter sp.]|uniref:phosphatase PAP2 family protein n=1 Tax=Ferruginibacter sp. TaxID=1940288 RepID=UPI002659B666|nr:phosphatase PAP2 family protein [Ferruginibacter sp.]MDB5275504.1 phosphatase family protein [Ferruginibacter sp.]
MKKRLQLLANQLTQKSLLIACLLIIFLFLFALITHEVVFENEASFDSKTIHFLSMHSSPAIIKIMRGVTFLGSFYFLAPAYSLLIAYLLLHKKTTYGISILAIAVSSTLVLFGLKLLFRRHRPALPLIQDIAGYSFPSGHALSAFIFCSILSYQVSLTSLRIIWKWILIALFMSVAIAIGISRIVLNVHYATDVLASFCLGIVWVLLSFEIFKKWHRQP